MRPLFFISICITLIFGCYIAPLLSKLPNIYYIPTNIPFNALAEPVKKQVECLAENIYFEAGNESVEGKIAVAMVTLNRVSSKNYANNVCNVVYQRTKTADDIIICQFSWTCQAKEMSNRLTIRQTSLYNDIRELSVRVFMNYGKITDNTKGSTYYHADYVNPGWNLSQTVKIGRHIFYKNQRDVIKLQGAI